MVVETQGLKPRVNVWYGWGFRGEPSGLVSLVLLSVVNAKERVWNLLRHWRERRKT